MGGYGILDLASNYPTLFAALIPICGGTILNQIKNLVKIPIWMFHGEKDDVIPVESSILIYQYLNKKNKNTLLTVYPNITHDSWTKTYENEKIYDWLLSFKIVMRSRDCISKLFRVPFNLITTAGPFRFKLIFLVLSQFRIHFLIPNAIG